MARFSLSFLAVFLVLAAFALSLPTKRGELSPTEDLGLQNALDDLKSATKTMEGNDNKDSNDKNNQSSGDKTSSNEENKESKGADTEDKKVDGPTPTQKKPTSGNFVTPTATHTHHATSKPNALGKLPLVGGLLGGTGGGL